MPLVVDPDRIEITAIRELVEIDGRRVVEIGCGDGRITFQYARQAAVEFIDSVRYRLLRVRRAAAA